MYTYYFMVALNIWTDKGIFDFTEFEIFGKKGEDKRSELIMLLIIYLLCFSFDYFSVYVATV